MTCEAMLPTKLPPPEPLTCDGCQVAKLTVTSRDFDSAWREIHGAGWLLMGARVKGRQRWRVLCERCKPSGDPHDPGPRGAAG